MKTVPGYGCAVANLLIAGLGTVICAFLTDKNINKTQLWVGLMQFLTAPFLIGYLLSIYWSYLMITKVGKTESELAPLNSGTPGRS
jgi:hypothetical protein